MEKNKKLLVVVGVLLVIGVGIAFGYYALKILFSGTGATTQSDTLVIGDTEVVVAGTLEFNDTDIYPGHKNVSSISVTATGTLEAIYNLIWTGTNTLNTPLNYTVYKTTQEYTPTITCEKVVEGTSTKIYYETCTESGFDNLGEAVATGEITKAATSTKFKLVKNETIQATENGAKVYYYVVLEYPNKEESQNIDVDGAFDGVTSIEVLEEKETDPLLYDTLMTYNKSTRTDFSTTMTAENTKTLYSAEDDDGTSYYFAGAPTDNWVKLGNMYWRIVRVNGDKSIRLIYNGTSNVTTGEGTIALTDVAYNTSYGDNMYVGYMYTSGEVHGYGTSSNIKTQLDNWYDSNLASYASNIDTNAGFCNDRIPYTDTEGTTTGGGTGATKTYYAPYFRIVKSTAPSLICTETNDLFTPIGSTNGNAKLSKPIGLITADEIVYAGGLYSTSNTSYYLYNNQKYSTMSPNCIAGGIFNYMFAINSDGEITGGGITMSLGVRPVINLRADVTFEEGGLGTSTAPYVIS